VALDGKVVWWDVKVLSLTMEPRTNGDLIEPLRF